MLEKRVLWIYTRLSEQTDRRTNQHRAFCGHNLFLILFYIRFSFTLFLFFLFLHFVPFCLLVSLFTFYICLIFIHRHHHHHCHDNHRIWQTKQPKCERSTFACGQFSHQVHDKIFAVYGQQIANDFSMTPWRNWKLKCVN